MSRKKKTPEAVPAEILAEGSGPVGEAADVTDDAEVAVVAAEAKPAKRARGSRKRGGADGDPGAEVVDADAANDDVIVAATMDPAEMSAEKPKRKRGSKRTADAPADLDASASVDTNDPDASAADADELDPVEDGDGASVVDAELGADDDELGAAVDARADDVADGLAAASDEANADEANADDANADSSVGESVETSAEAEVADGPILPAAMDAVQLRQLVEALIFATDRPITLQRIRQLSRISDVKRIEQALAELAEDYKDRGIALHQVSGGYQFRTNTAFSPWVQQLIAGRPVRLSRAQLETLAIIAYRQPITRPEIDEIRGVDSSATLRLLLDRALVRVLGKREEVGRPILYGTTKEFLDFFSLSDLRELPTLREYSELTAESRQVMSDRLGVPLGEEPGISEMGAEMGVGLGDIDVGIGRSDGDSELGDLGDPADLAGSFPAASAAAAADASDAAIDAAFEGDTTGTDDDAMADTDDDPDPADLASDDDESAFAPSHDDHVGRSDASHMSSDDAHVERSSASPVSDDEHVEQLSDDEHVERSGARYVSSDDDQELASATNTDELEDSLSARAARRLRELDDRAPSDEMAPEPELASESETASASVATDQVETATELDPVTFDHSSGEQHGSAEMPIDEPNE